VLDALGVSLIDAIYACPFHPDHPQRFAELAGWRKPADGMLLAAAADYGLDLQRSILVGDSLSDVRAGWSAGLPAAAHVLTGHGVTERAAVIAAAEAEGGEHRARLMLVNSIADLCPSALRR
jgi:D-glycero-D-manno-heptose 1,7-bisphosphate phosphatase